MLGTENNQLPGGRIPEDGSLEGNTGLYKHNNLELSFKSDEQNQKPAAQWIGTGCRGKKLKCV